MNEHAMQCPKCQGSMEQGYLPETVRGGAFVSTWARGEPTGSFWTGVKLARGSDRLPLGAFRCQSCGFLELYAREEFAAK